MKYYFKIKVNSEILNVGINKPELIYGATAIVVNKKIDGYAINPVTKEKMEIFYHKVKNLLNYHYTLHFMLVYQLIMKNN